MVKRIAIEQNLDNIKEYLEKKGVSVEKFSGSQLINSSDVGRYDAIVISGSNKDLMGIQDTVTKVPVIDAAGMSPEEIFSRISH